MEIGHGLTNSIHLQLAPLFVVRELIRLEVWFRKYTPDLVILGSEGILSAIRSSKKDMQYRTKRDPWLEAYQLFINWRLE